MDGGIDQLQGSLNGTAAPGENTHIFSLGVVGVHAAQRGQPQAAALLDLGHHGPQRIGVCLQQSVLLAAAAKRHQYAAFDGDLRRKAQRSKCIAYKGGGLCRVAGG